MEEENKQLKEQVLKLDILMLRQAQRSRIDSIEVQGCRSLQMRSVVKSFSLQPREGDVQVAHLVKSFSCKRPYHILP